MKYLLLFLLLIIPVIGFSQTITISAGNANSGTVGIGTTNRIGQYIAVNTIGSPHNDVIDSNGNIGVGSSNPGQKVDVQGTIRTIGFTMPTGASTNYVLTSSDNNGTATWSANTGSSQWTGTSPIYYNGNVGINSLTPGQALDIGGTVRATAFVPNYLGFVATRAEPAQGTDGNTQMMSRTFHIAMTNIYACKLVFPNWTSQINETGNGGTATLTASVEYPSGTFNRITFNSGITSVSIASGSTVFSDTINLSTPIPEGALFWVRTYYTNPNGVIYQFFGFNTSGYDSAEEGTSGIVDQTMIAGTVAATPAANVYLPEAIIGYTNKPSILIFGDSRAIGGTGTPSVFGSGYELLVGRYYGYSNMSLSSAKMSDYITNHAQRNLLIPYATHVITEFGINDLNAGTTAVQLEAYDKTLSTYLSVPLYATTLEPFASSADSFRTLNGQTVSNVTRATYNDDLRNHLVPGVSNYIEMADTVESSRDSGKWMVNGQPNYVSSGSGLHPNQGGYALEANALIPIYGNGQSTLQTSGGAIQGLVVNGNLINVGGNTGIGTGNPTGVLDVEGTVNAAIFFADVPSTGVNKNIGIGSFTPGEKLDVQGTIRTTGFTLTTGASSGNVLVSNSLGLGTWMTPTTLPLQVPLNLTTTGSSGASTLSVQGTLNIPQYTGGGGSGTVSSGTVNELAYYSGATTVSSAVSGTDVGIGSSNPNFTLDVNGTIRAITSGDVINGMLVQNTSSGSNSEALMQVKNDVNNSVYMAANSSTNNGGGGSTGILAIGVTSGQALQLGDSTNASMMSIINNNVGIASITPGQSLDIQGTARMKGFILNNNPVAGSILMSNSVGLGTWIPASAVGTGSGSTTPGGGLNAIAYNSPIGTFAGTENKLSFNGTNVGIGTTNGRSLLEVQGTVTTNAFQVTVAGNVGVGTNSPSSAFYVNTGNGGGMAINEGAAQPMAFIRNASATSYNLISFSNSSANTNNTSILGGGTNDPYLYLNANSGGGVYIRPNGSATVLDVFNSSGNLGVGTVSNANTISVNGNLSVGSSANVGVAGTTNGLYVQGNIGIASLTPGQKLDIQGTVRLNGPAATLISKQTTPRTVANNDCGTTSQGAVVAGSTDLSGTVTVGTLNVTSCAVTYNGTFGVAANCICGDDSSNLAIRCVPTTTKLTITALTSMSSDNVTWWCPSN